MLLHICLHNEVRFLSNHIVVCINCKDMLYSFNKLCAQRFIEFTDKNLKPKVKLAYRFIYIMN